MMSTRHENAAAMANMPPEQRARMEAMMKDRGARPWARRRHPDLREPELASQEKPSPAR